MSQIVQVRRFAVHERAGERHHARLVEERSFEAAAVAWMEAAPVMTGEPEISPAEISLVVRDLESGHEHCFRLDLETGEATEGC